MNDIFYREHVYLLITRENKDALKDIPFFQWFSDYTPKEKKAYQDDVGLLSTPKHTFHFSYHNNVIVDESRNWISVKDKLPDNKENLMTTHYVLIDIDAGLGPFLATYDHSEGASGFMVRDVSGLKRVICTHYMELPIRPIKA